MEKENQLSEKFIKMQMDKALQEYGKFQLGKPTADKESLFAIGYCIGGFASVTFIINVLEEFIRRADEEIKKSIGIEKQRNIAQKKTFEDLYRVLDGITKGYKEEI